MTTKVQGTNGIEFPDGSVQGSAAYSKAQSDANDPMIAFSAEQRTDPSVLLPSGTAVKCRFDSVKRNDGGGYNSATATFTAPVSGWYQFTAGMAMHPVTNYADVQLWFNVGVNAVRKTNGNDDGRLQTTVILFLSSGETIHVEYIQTSSGQMYQGWGEWQAYFQGVLIKKG